MSHQGLGYRRRRADRVSVSGASGFAPDTDVESDVDSAGVPSPGSALVGDGSPVEDDVVQPTDADPDEGDVEEPTDEDDVEEDYATVLADNVAAVLAYIDAHPDERDAVLAAERAGKARKGILDG